MSDLGDLLELLHRGGAGERTLRAVVSSWSDPEVAAQAFRAAAEEDGGAVFTAYAAVGEDEMEALDPTRVTHLWRAPPDRAREEVRDGERCVSVGVRRGAVWWDYDERHGAMTNEDDPAVGAQVGEEHEILFEPARLLGSLSLSVSGRGEVAGRPVVLASARPRSRARIRPGEDDWALHEIGTGADEWELAVDAEHGVLLRVEARRDGRPFLRLAVHELAIGEELDDSLFVFTPPEGEELRSVADDFEVDHALRLDELARRAPFVVFVPERLKPGWTLHSTLVTARDQAPNAHLHIASDDGHWQVTIGQVAAADAPEEHFDALDRPDAWRTIERGGREIAVREPSEHWAATLARLELEGTRITLSSDGVDAEQLVDLATRLVPAPEAPPEL